jgi:hypothetical protein
MTREQKQKELQRHRTILLATLDYLEQHFGGSFVVDELDFIAEYYQQQKLQTEKYFKQRRLDRLQQQLARLTKGLQSGNGLDFTLYIKEKTGYDIDIFEDLKNRVAAVVAQNDIRSQNELSDIYQMLQIYHQESDHREEAAKLNRLVNDYSEQTSAVLRKRQSNYSEVVSTVEKNGMVTVTVTDWTGPKPKHFEEQEATSPDGQRTVRVTQWSYGKHPSTYVTVHFPTASGAVYGTSGICTDIKARWKDNSCIVIETKKKYEANTRAKLVRSFQDVITIEYIES